MTRHVSLPATLGILAVTIGLLALLLMFSEDARTALFGEKTPTLLATSTATVIPSLERPDYTVVTEIKQDDDETTISVSYPTEAPEEVERYVLDTLAEFRTVADNERFGGQPYFLDTKVDVKLAGEFESFVIESYQYTGGANANGFAKTFVYQDGSLVGLSDVIAIDERKEEIITAVETYLGNLGPGGSGTFDDVFDNNSVFEDFYVTDQSFGFIFSEYEIAPGAAGVVTVEIPRVSTKQVTTNKERDQQQIGSFESCLDNNGTILESYPRQCVDKTGTYREVISDTKQPGDSIALEVTIGPEKVPCVGVGTRECLVVDGNYFYDAIEGFDHKSGVESRVILERTLAWNTEDPRLIPADVGLYAFRLIEIISEKTVGDQAASSGCVVAGCSAQLCISQEEAEAGGGVSTCEFREEYGCYAAATCETQSNDQCGWTETNELQQCIAEARSVE